jgi:hypothetical protein
MHLVAAPKALMAEAHGAVQTAARAACPVVVVEEDSAVAVEEADAVAVVAGAGKNLKSATDWKQESWR